ncbi:mitochondrial transcription termination factor 3 [Calliopsis andreniformis]|uniref:mitochondrial transcription termination factor 3 n=1 Tax=Calliopsis andreniformis TaxID=337506 RepID=UPI003FCEB0ED
MVLSRSYIMLRAACRKTGGTKNFILKNALENTKFLAHLSTNIPKEKTSNEVFKQSQSPEYVGHRSADYTDELKSKAFVNCNINNEDDNELKMSNEINGASSAIVPERRLDEVPNTLEDLNGKLAKLLKPCYEDLSDVGPYMTPTYNFAKFANDSYTIQQLVKLGVNLHKLEADRDIVELYLSLDFDRDIKPYVRFLHDCGVLPENLGNFITKCPKIFKEDMDDLHTRIRYLRAHKFTPEMIQLIVNRHPPWLCTETKKIDYRLGHFQHTFKLSGFQLRCLTIKCPKLITYDMTHIRKNTFSVKEEMGFSPEETQRILLKTPYVWIHTKFKVLSTFDYAHNLMKLSHKIISQQSNILICRKSRLQQRHLFLVELKRDQYDSTKPLYISPEVLVSGNDIEFCKNVAKASINTYNMFLKTM